MNHTANPVVVSETPDDHMSLRPLLALPVLCSLATTAATSGCVVVDNDNPPPPYDPYGDISFLWSFDGLTDCDLAGVDEVDIAVFQNGSLIDQIEREPCVGGGLTLIDYFEGQYEVEIDAYARNDALLYSGGFITRVVGGTTTDSGLITLDAIGDVPNPPVVDGFGDLAFFWSFVYPTDQPIIDCDLAGVRDIVVDLDGPAGERLTETFRCDEDAGALFEGLLEGRWTMQLDAFGTYHNDDLHLYGATVEFVVDANREIDLGDVVLERDEGSFADVQVDWDFNGTTCRAEGIADVSIAIHRAGTDEAEDVFARACADGTVLRNTFVPGTYTITVDGVGIDADWFSSVVIDLGPDTTAIVPLQLAPGA